MTYREPTRREELLWRLAEWWCRLASALDVLRGRAIAVPPSQDLGRWN